MSFPIKLNGVEYNPWFLPIEFFQAKPMQKTALVTGITGQDGAYLAKLLLDEDYRVIGVMRRTSLPNTGRLRSYLCEAEFELLTLVEGDVTDAFSISSIINQFRPDEVYNLAAQSHVGTSFQQPLYTWATAAEGCLNCLEAIRRLDVPAVRFYQASTSEMFGSYLSVKTGKTRRNYQGFTQLEKDWDVDSERYSLQDELTPFAPNSPYAVAKLAAHNMVRVYRESYGIHASAGILFNHESPLRGEAFVTQKIIKHLVGMKMGRREPLRLGNIDAKRDWGYAGDYVEAMWLMLQQETADDYVIATGETHSVREFLQTAIDYLHLKFDFEKDLVIDPTLFRPCEVPYLRGDPTKAKEVLNWTAKTTFAKLVEHMCCAEIYKHTQAG